MKQAFDLTTIAAQYPFSALDAPMQAAVLAEMPAAAYDQLHQILRTARTMDADIAPPPALAARLQAHIANRRPQQPSPPAKHAPAIWKTLALLAAAFVAGWCLRPLPDPVVSAPVTVWQIQRDTVIQEKIIWKTRVVTRWIPVVAVDLPQASTIQPVDSVVVVVNQTQPAWSIEDAPQAIGIPLSAQPELMDFFMVPGGK